MGNVLDFIAGAARIVEWLAAFAVCVSVKLLQNHAVSRGLVLEPRVVTVQRMGLVSLAYATAAIALVVLLKRVKPKAWYVCAIASIPGDLHMIGLFFAVVFMRRSVRILEECHAQPPKPGFFMDVANKFRQSLASMRFGHQPSHPPPGHGGFCHFPAVILVMCNIAMSAYILSIVLTIIQLKKHRKDNAPELPQSLESHPGHVEEVVPLPHRPEVLEVERPVVQFVPAQQVALPTQHQPAPSLASLNSLSHGQFRPPASSMGYLNNEEEDEATLVGRRSEDTTVSFDPDLYLVTDGFRGQPAGQTTHHRPAQLRETANWSRDDEATLNGRPSMETTVSFDPDLYLVTDGFRRPDDPPEYSSRPPSLYAQK